MTLSELAAIIEPIIPEGKGRAIKMRNLSAVISAGIGSRVGNRRIRKAIEHHLPWICSSSSKANPGYYKADTTAERRAAVDYLESYIGSLAHRRRAIMDHYSADFAGRQTDLFQQEACR